MPATKEETIRPGTETEAETEEEAEMDADTMGDAIMPRATLEFILPEDEREHYAAVNANNLSEVITRMLEWLAIEARDRPEHSGYSEAEEKLYALCDLCGVDVDMLVTGDQTI